MDSEELIRYECLKLILGGAGWVPHQAAEAVRAADVLHKFVSHGDVPPAPDKKADE